MPGLGLFLSVSANSFKTFSKTFLAKNSHRQLIQIDFDLTVTFILFGIDVILFYWCL